MGQALCFLLILLFSILNDPGLQFKFLRRGNWGSERLSDFLNVTQPVGDRHKSKTRGHLTLECVASALISLKEGHLWPSGRVVQRVTGVCSKPHCNSKAELGLDELLTVLQCPQSSVHLLTPPFLSVTTMLRTPPRAPKCRQHLWGLVEAWEVVSGWAGKSPGPGETQETYAL